ncbi:tetratricopeptide repeat protein [Thiolapillus sp.]
MKLSKVKTVAVRISVLLIVLLVAWRILVSGLGEHFVRQALLGDEQAVDQALLWNPDHPVALYLKGKALMQDDRDRAEQLLRKAIVLNPGNAAPMEVLAQLLLDKGKLEEADRMISLAVRQMPAHKNIRLNAARYWVERGQLVRAMENWAVALELDPGLGNRIYPALSQIAENQQSLGMFKFLTDAPPPWWDAFFEYLSKHAKKLETVVAVASIRHASPAPLSRTERNLLVERLQQDQQWAEAYLVWINGLDVTERRYLGSVFDGGFELPPANAGFGWHFPEDEAWVIRRKHTYGAEGEKALYINYKGGITPKKQVYQPLLLSKGHYAMSMRIRADRLRIQGGLQWVVRCMGDDARLLGEGALLVGASDWETQQFTFEVPGDKACTGQLLRLEMVGKNGDERIVEGELWFERLSIRKLE